MSVEILPTATQQRINYLFDNPEEIEVLKLEGYSGRMCNKHVHSTMTRSSRLHCLTGVINKPTTDRVVDITCIPTGALKTQVLENANTEKASAKQCISQGWKTHVQKMQVRKMQVQCNSHRLFNWCLKCNVAQRKNKINSVSCLIVKPHGSRYCTATHGTVGIGGD